MDVRTQTVTSSTPWRLGFGKFFMLIGTTDNVSVQFFKNKSSIALATNVQAGYKTSLDFDSVEITSSTSQSVKAGINRFGDGGYDRSQGEVVVANSSMAPVYTRPVSGITVIDDTITVGTTQIVAGGGGVTSRRGLRLRADPTNTANISIGSTGLTAGETAIELAPGDVWIETEAPGSNFYAISTASGQTLYRQLVF